MSLDHAAFPTSAGRPGPDHRGARGDHRVLQVAAAVSTLALPLRPACATQLVLAPSPKAKGKRRTMAISKRRHETCTQRRPQYEHHCILVFRHAGFHVRAPQRLPCKLERCHVNLVADVHHPRASANEILVVGGQRPSGKIKGDRGRINAIRYRDTLPSDFRRPAPGSCAAARCRPISSAGC